MTARANASARAGASWSARRRVRVGEQGRVAPERLAVAAPDQPDLPAGPVSPRIPLALAALHQPALGEPVGSAAASWLASSRFSGPSAATVHCGRGHVVERDEGRLAAHGQLHAGRRQPLVDLSAQPIQVLELGRAVGLGDPRVLVHPDARSW